MAERSKQAAFGGGPFFGGKGGGFLYAMFVNIFGILLNMLCIYIYTDIHTHKYRYEICISIKKLRIEI